MRQTLMNILCNDVAFHISTYLTTEDILRLCRVSKNSDKIWGNSMIWKNILIRDVYGNTETFDFKKVFKLLYLKNKCNSESRVDCDMLLCSHEFSGSLCGNCRSSICKKHTNIFKFKDNWDGIYESVLCDICFENRDNLDNLDITNIYAFIRL